MGFPLGFVNGTKFFYERPDLVLDVGIRGALNTIDAAKKYDVEKYIMASSSEVYQQPTVVPTTEDERIIIPDISNPRFSYSGGKILSELLTLHYFSNSDTQRIVFRPHNVYGPDMGWEHVIPEFMRRVRFALIQGRVEKQILRSRAMDRQHVHFALSMMRRLVSFLPPNRAVTAHFITSVLTKKSR